MLEDKDPAKRVLLEEMGNLFDFLTGEKFTPEPNGEAMLESLNALYEDRYAGAPMAGELSDADWGDAFLRNLETAMDPNWKLYRKVEDVLRDAGIKERDKVLKAIEDGLHISRGRRFPDPEEPPAAKPKERRVFVVALESDAPVDLLERAVRGGLEDMDAIGELGETGYTVDSVEITPPR